MFLCVCAHACVYTYVCLCVRISAHVGVLFRMSKCPCFFFKGILKVKICNIKKFGENKICNIKKSKGEKI